MSTPAEYVCILTFDEEMRETIFVQKSKGPTPDNPNGQIGKFNGLGGKRETYDISHRATAFREYLEETDIQLQESELRYMVTEHYPVQAIVHYYYIKSQRVFDKLSEMSKTLDGDFLSVNSVGMFCQLAVDKNYNHAVWNLPYLVAKACAYDRMPKNYWPIR